jgi:hypothetical protein
MTTEQAASNHIETGLALFAEVSKTYARYRETEAGSPEEIQVGAELTELHSRISAIMGLPAPESATSLPPTSDLYAVAIRNHYSEVRDGAQRYLDGALGFRTDERLLAPNTLTFGVSCVACFPGVSTLGVVDDTQLLSRWLARNLFVPEAQIKVHPMPVLPSLCFSELPEVLHFVLTGKMYDATKIAEEFPWTPYGTDPAISPSHATQVVVFFVTIKIESAEQHLRLMNAISEGACPDQTPPFEVPFTVEGTQRHALVGPVNYSWPCTAMMNSVFLDVEAALDHAIEALKERNVPLSEVVAEIRTVEDGQSIHRCIFEIELRETTHGVILSRVPGLSWNWIEPFVSTLLEVAERHGLKNVAHRKTPESPLYYFLEHEEEIGAAEGAAKAKGSGAVPTADEPGPATATAEPTAPNKDLCPKCGKDWNHHDFGVPAPMCP